MEETAEITYLSTRVTHDDPHMTQYDNQNFYIQGRKVQEWVRGKVRDLLTVQNFMKYWRTEAAMNKQ